VLFGPLEDLVDREALVVRHVEMLDSVSLDPFLLAVRLITQVPDRYSLRRGLVGFAVHRQEVVDFLLGLELGRKGLDRYSDLCSGARCSSAWNLLLHFF
jgi:hypothetical protein